jgi:lipopolysaccharide biosynthesis glycosyltransferase
VSHSNIKKIIWAGCQVRPIAYPIYNPNYIINDNSDDEQKERKNDDHNIDEIWSNVNYNQIWIWSLQQAHYRTIIYIDYDHIVLSNINHLFDRRQQHQRKDTKSLLVDNERPFMAAAPHNLISNQFDSSVMIIEPDISLFQEMADYIKRGEVGGIAIDRDGKETATDDTINAKLQSVNYFLNQMIYPNWYSMPSIHRLEPIYNAPYEWTLHEYIWLSHRTEIQIFHYTSYNKPENIISSPSKYRVSKYAAPLIYLWSLVMFFVSAPLVNLEEETRYAIHKVFDIRKDSDNVIAYIERMKRGGTRRRLGLQEEEETRNRFHNDEL